ncbi:MAG: acyl-phosphate glycerol 3-phosphate acyltransferase [Coxiella sp. (in: Bacteria)]|nr:MAG: acyl-phosphate glycerol 3-phosphate acyltransferase [Coxiella sp. (in: g-proteobacteria)]
MAAIVSIVIAYLIGSLNMSIIIAKLLGKPDPRTVGSGNAGATNVLRTGSKQDAAWVLIGDIVKGVIAVVIARIFHVEGFLLGIVALAAIVGHVFPIYFKFKGGKGVATMMGVLIALNIWIGVISLAVWVIVALLIRYASLASLSAATAAVICSLIFGHFTYFVPLLIIAALIFWKHMGNIERLKAGTEGKIKF